MCIGRSKTIGMEKWAESAHYILGEFLIISYEIIYLVVEKLPRREALRDG